MNDCKVYKKSLFDQFSRLWSSCCLCDQPTGRHLDLCEPCQSTLPWLKNPCPRCAFPKPQAESICADCEKRTPLQQQTVSLFNYDFPLNRLLADFKYQHRFEYGQLFAELFALHISETFSAEALPQALIPIPLHPQKQQIRGYNQAMLLAKKIGKRLKIPVIANALIKIKQTESQANSTAAQREKNLQQAFEVKNTIFLPSHIALVDDIYTTGATVRAAIEALQLTTVSRVDVWTIGRTP